MESPVFALFGCSALFAPSMLKWSKACSISRSMSTVDYMLVQNSTLMTFVPSEEAVVPMVFKSSLT